MTIATKFLALVNGIQTVFTPVVVSTGSGSAGGLVGLGSDGRLDNSLGKSVVTLTYAASMTLDLGTYSSMLITLGGSLALPNPTSLVVGNSGAIVLVQDGTGSRVLSAAGTSWLFPGATLPVLSTIPGAIDVLSYQVLSSTQILVAPLYGFAHS